MSFTTKENSSEVYFLKLVLTGSGSTFFRQLDLDPDPHSEKLLDPDQQKMNADPQPWKYRICTTNHFAQPR